MPLMELVELPRRPDSDRLDSDRLDSDRLDSDRLDSDRLGSSDTDSNRGLKPPPERAKARRPWAAPPKITPGTSITNRFREEEGQGETNRAIPCASVTAVCAPGAAPRQRTWTSASLTPVPSAVAIITAAAALPSDCRAATASAYSGAGETNALADAMAVDACTLPEPDFRSHPFVRMSPAVAWRRGRTVPGLTPLPISAAAAALAWAVAGEGPANSHQLICEG